MKKRVIACLLVLTLLLSFTGCSTAELGYYNTVKGMSALKDYSFEGSLGLKIENLKINLKTMKVDPATEIMDLLNNKTVIYDGLINSTDNIIKFNLGIKSGTEPVQNFLKFIFKNNKYYLSGEAFNNFADPDITYDKETIDGNEYSVLNQEQFSDFLLSLIDSFNFDDIEPVGKIKTMTDDYSSVIGNIIIALSSSTPADNINSIIYKLTDKFINNYFSGLQLGIVSKAGDNKYKAELNGEKLAAAYKSLMTYIIDNPKEFVDTLQAVANSLTDEELNKLDISRENLNKVIGRITLPTEEDITEAKKGIDETVEGMNEVFSRYKFNLVNMLEKTGPKSYNINNSFNIYSVENAEVPIELNATITSSLIINKENAGNIGTKAVVSTAKGASAAVITITEPAPDAVAYGVLCSLTDDFKNPVTVNGIKQADGTYKVDLSSLKPGTQYYFKTFYQDTTGNIIVSSEVKNFMTPAVVNSNTGDNINSVAVLSILLVIAVGAVLTLRKKRIFSK